LIGDEWMPTTMGACFAVAIAARTVLCTLKLTEAMKVVDVRNSSAFKAVVAPERGENDLVNDRELADEDMDVGSPRVKATSRIQQ
jgi:hypothetical protein